MVWERMGLLDGSLTGAHDAAITPRATRSQSLCSVPTTRVMRRLIISQRHCTYRLLHDIVMKAPPSHHRSSAKIFFFFSSRRRHTRLVSDWSSDVCSSD